MTDMSGQTDIAGPTPLVWAPAFHSVCGRMWRASTCTFTGVMHVCGERTGHEPGRHHCGCGRELRRAAS